VNGFSTPDRAELALLLEVAGTPKPGNVDRRRDPGGLRFGQFLAGAVGARPGLERAADPAGPPVGEAFERAVAGMSRAAGTNTQFGCLLLLAPLVRAAARDALSPSGAAAVAEATTVDDAAAFYRAFDRVDVAVPDLPADAGTLDVRQGAGAVPALRERGLTLYDVMADSPTDGNAREWTGGFERTFAAAGAIRDDEGPATDRAARAFLRELASEPDTLVATEHGFETARALTERAEPAAAAAAEGEFGPAEALAEALVEEGINPGTTADVTCAALFVALERGLEP